MKIKLLVAILFSILSLGANASLCLNEHISLRKASGFFDSRLESLNATPCFVDANYFESEVVINLPYFEITNKSEKIGIDGNDYELAAKFCESLDYPNVKQIINDGRVSREETFFGFISSIASTRKVVDNRGGTVYTEDS